LLQVIAEHLYQQGNFTVGDTFVQEAGICNAAALKKPYTAMHAVLEQVILWPSLPFSVISGSAEAGPAHLHSSQELDVYSNIAINSSSACYPRLAEKNLTCRG